MVERFTTAARLTTMSKGELAEKIERLGQCMREDPQAGRVGSSAYIGLRDALAEWDRRRLAGEL